ncbi:DNA phosphorothioation-dependent restriction protein DptG [Lutibacter holmesii]|uniref:DNA phosphorothioation-dependent restriction protein DptG n=1 Tax=Lutibacter holmesii TaxID=1137985 RepID=A0ABW3WKA7_9FLAO
MMNIELKEDGKDGLNKLYFKGGKFSHVTGSKLKFLPFSTKYNKGCKSDFSVFQGVVGECFRISNDKQFNKELIKDKENSFKTKLKKHILEEVLKKVDTEQPEDFKEVIINLFFEEDGDLIKFNKKMLSYMHFIKEHAILKETSKFFYDIFLNTKILNNKDLVKSENDNLFYKLIIESLPELEDKPKVKTSLKYTNVFDEITELFLSDFNTLSNREDLFLEHIEDLFKYYYFFYLSQTAICLNNFGESKVIKPICYSMDWETLSETRRSYNFGWKHTLLDLENLFSHANTLELLNYISINDEKIGDYANIVERYKKLSESEAKDFILKINELSEFYKPQIESLKSPFKMGKNWLDCEKSLSNRLAAKKFNNDIQVEIYSLFYRIDYQFKNSQRDKPYKDYSNWLIDFFKSNYTKFRGRLGYTTSINQETLLFLTKICINNKDKIRLKSLWRKLEQRGISFDETSKVEIVKLFERINLLEKKSDSGDAQYVKSII